MTRMAAETIQVKPKSNLFTWLAFVAVVLNALALAMIYLRFPADK
jgi:hypothetical protein